MTAEQRALAAMIDHTLLKPEAQSPDILKLCAEARAYTFASVCVNPVFVRLAAAELRNSPVKVCTVIGFPLGAHCSQTKTFEAAQALEDGAQELDMVLNVGALLEKNYEYVEQDIRSVVETGHSKAAIVKVIIETALLDETAKIAAADIVSKAGADFIKTSTGFAAKGATVEDVRLLRRHIHPQVKVKASGGIRDLAFTQELLASGAERIGASAGVAIIDALVNERGGASKSAEGGGY